MDEEHESKEVDALEKDNQEDVSADGKVRLQKIIADRGFCSRRKAEEYITAGRVTVDRVVVDKLGSMFKPDAKIEIDGYPLSRPGQKVYLAVYKPLGFICTANDPQDRKLVTQLVPPQYGRVFPVGRLDINSEGLILLTNDGDFSNLIMHPSSAPDKVYEVKIDKRLTSEEMEKLRNGVLLDDGWTSPALVKEVGISLYGCTYQLTIHEGKNREIRRMMEHFGRRVLSLKRTAIGTIRLKDMPRGSYKEIPPKVVDQMVSDCKKRKVKNDILRRTKEASVK